MGNPHMPSGRPAKDTARFDDVDTDFNSRFNDLYRDAFRSAYRLRQNREDCEDIAIESLARAYVRWNRIRGDPTPWVRKVAMNLAIDLLRRDKITTTIEIPSKTDGFVQNVELHDALNRLSSRSRSIVLMRYFLDMTEVEVASSLGCSVGTVKQTTHRAVKKLRRSV